MAVRMDADGEDYTRALALGTQTALTVCGWFMLSVDRNTWSTIFSIDNGTSDNWLMQTDADGTTMHTVFDATGQQGIGTMTVGTWYFICLATSGTTGNIYYRTAANPTLTTVAVTSVTANVNAATLRLGESPWGGEWWNGRIAAVQVYNVQLSAAEAQNESMQYVPRRLTNLLSWHPLVKPETTDYSGNARTLSGGAGTTTEDGPPIPWRVVSPRLTVPPAGAAGIAESGTATVGVAASGVAVKVAKVTGTCSLGVSSTGRAAKVSARTGTATTGLAATGTAKKRAPDTGVAAFGASTAGTAARKVAQAGGTPLGVAATRTGVATRAKSGTTAVGLTGTGTAAKSAVERGAAPVGMAPSGQASKKTTQAGAATVGITGSRSGTTTRAVSGVCSVGVSATGTARKVSTQTGSASVGVAAAGTSSKTAKAAGVAAVGFSATRAGVIARALSGACSVGLTAAGRGTKTAVVVGSSSAGLFARAAATKRSAHIAAVAVGLAAGSVAGKRAPVNGRAWVAIAGDAVLEVAVTRGGSYGRTRTAPDATPEIRAGVAAGTLDRPTATGSLLDRRTTSSKGVT